MTAPSPQTPREDLFDQLGYLSGHFDTASPQDQRAVEQLQQQLVRILGHDDLSSVRHQFFSIDGSDLFFSEAIPSPQRARLSQLVESVELIGDRAPELRVFVRNVPVRSTLIPGSTPAWAAGASVAQTLGPFTGVDGRPYWFDFFRITRLVALYVQESSEPALLFNAEVTPSLVANARTAHKLVPDSIWINAKLLASNAPPGLFAGLKIRRGTLTLSAPLTQIGGKWTLAATTRASVALELDSMASPATDDESAYGVDARRVNVQLPRRFAFHFTGNVSAIDEIGEDISRHVYGQTTSFQWSSRRAPEYDPTLKHVLIPLDCRERRVEIAECQSPIITFAGAADIEKSAWALPVAELDINRTSPAAGIGGLATRSGKGLTTQWQGLQGGAIWLTNPWLLCDPGRISVTELQAGNVFCTQDYALWKDDANPYGATVELRYGASFPFYYTSFANGNEAYLALADARSMLDRPVAVTGSPLNVRSRNSAVLVSASKTARLLSLYDDNPL